MSNSLIRSASAGISVVCASAKASAAMVRTNRLRLGFARGAVGVVDGKQARLAAKRTRESAFSR